VGDKAITRQMTRNYELGRRKDKKIWPVDIYGDRATGAQKDLHAFILETIMKSERPCW
jgi:hypothetical protein